MRSGLARRAKLYRRMGKREQAQQHLTTATAMARERLQLMIPS